MFKKNLLAFSLIWAVFSLSTLNAYAQAKKEEVKKNPTELVKSYAVIDVDSGELILAQEEDKILPPASITKLMTAYVVFTKLKEGKIKLTDMVPVSKNAYKQQGSRMFIEINSEVSVENLLRGLVIQSGNDAAVALAEYVSGTVEDFTVEMNSTAAKLGLINTHYTDATGLSSENHYSSAKDIALLARAIINDFPEYYHYYSEKEFTWNKINQKNRNRLLWRNSRVDGLKTGHTKQAGYCLAASEKRDGLRLISAVLGAEKEADRYEASQALLNEGFAQYVSITPISANQILSTAELFKGKEKTVEVMAQNEVKINIFQPQAKNISAKLLLDEPLIAPLKKGDKVGVIKVVNGAKILAQINAVAANDAPKGGLFKRMSDGIKLWWRK